MMIKALNTIKLRARKRKLVKLRKGIDSLRFSAEVRVYQDSDG